MAHSTAQTKALRAGYLTTLEKIKIRNLYLTQQLPHQAIAQQIGKTVGQVERYVSKSGLVKVKRERERKHLVRADERMENRLDEVSEVLASEAEEIALSGLTRARSAVEATHKDAPKDYQAWTAGIRNLITARNLARGRDNSNTLGEGEAGRSVNLFFLQGGATEAKGMKVVDTVDDVL